MVKKQRKLKLPIANWLTAIVCLGIVAAAAAFWLSPAKAPAVQVYFFKADKPFAVSRAITPDRAPLETAINELLKGPTEAEKADGISTQLPAGIRARAIRADRAIAIVDFNGKLEAYGGGSNRVEGMVAQIVYTATAVPGINQAWIWLNGEKEVVLGGEGLVLDRPLGRSDLAY
jgi:spore germination protein GerM